MKLIFLFSMCLSMIIATCGGAEKSTTTNATAPTDKAMDKTKDDKTELTTNDNEHLQLNSAVKSPFKAHIASQTGGTLYRIIFTSKTDEPIMFTGTYVGDMGKEMRQQRDSFEEVGKPLQQGQRIILNVKQYKEGYEAIADDIPHNLGKCPKAYDGQALVEYTINGEKHFFVVKEFMTGEKGQPE